MKRSVFLISIAASLFALGAQPKAAGTHHKATVLDTVNAGGYTYIDVKEGTRRYWIAVPAANVAKGQNVAFTEQMKLQNFHSKSLDRDFKQIVFAVLDTPAAAPAENILPAAAPKHVIAKLPGGYSVAEVFANHRSIAGKTVKVRGVVTKISRGIMKRDWVHIEDGTGGTGDDDLVFTASDAGNLAAGDTVVAEGRATVDKDIGFGYFYPVLIENARFVKETQPR